MLQQHHAKDDFGGRARTATGLAFPAASGEFLLNDQQQGVVFQSLIGMAHPGFPQIAHSLMNEAVSEALLLAARGDHGSDSLPLDSSRSRRSNC
jgi:hypothetical protein